MNNNEIKKLCLDLMNAQDSKEVVELLKKYDLWDNDDLWRNYGEREGSWGTINNQGNPAFALTEKITNAVDAVLMNKCWESGKDPKSGDRLLPKSPRDAVHKYFETNKEIKSYNLDKSLFDENLEDVAGLQQYWTDKKSREIAEENINLSVSGDKGYHPNVIIADKGEGQTPEKLPKTIMSLHVGNKKAISFAQGKWNQGGAGAILHCGQDSKIQLQFVLTRRNPKILKKFSDQKSSLSQNWSFTILRRNKPKLDTDVSEAKYLCPLEDDNGDRVIPLNFSSDEMAIFPQKGSQFTKKSEHGTVIILYEYKIATSAAIFGSDSLFRQLDIQLPRIPLPVRLHETRKKKQTAREQSITNRGFSNFQENQFIKKKEDSNLEDITPRRGYLRTDENNYKIVYDIYCFKKGKGATYIPNNAGLLWTLNGQTHAISKKELFRIDKLAFDIIAKDLLIVIDCTSIKGADREDFFKSSRDRLNPDSPIYKEIRQKLIDDLSEHTSLQELIEKRIDESVKDDQIEDEDTIAEIQKLLRELPDDEKDFLPPGFQITKPKKVEEGSGKFNLPKKKFPTFFCFEELKEKNQKKQEIKEQVEINKSFSLRLFTDAETDYFERDISKGKMTVNWSLNGNITEAMGYSGPFLKDHGLCTLKKIKPPTDIKPGETIDLEILVTDRQNKDGYKLKASVLVKPAQVKPKKPKKPKIPKPKPPIDLPPEGGQGINTIDEVIENPIIAKFVEPEEWKDITGQDVDEDDVLHVERSKKNEKLNYNLFLNKQNINLKNELRKADAKYTQKIIETKYKMGISLIAMFSLMQYRKDQRRKKLYTLEGTSSEGSEENLSVDDKLTILVATKNAGKGIFMLSDYLHSIGKQITKTKVSEIEE